MYGVCLNKRNDDDADEAKKEPSIEQVRVRQSEDEMGIRKGPWSIEEDTILVNYIATHGGGHRWNSLARAIGLKRSGKSCRLRWLNYLCPGVRRGNITLQEQITILDLYSRWGNRWSEIARHLPGRTDSEVRNYWRTRVVKKAKQLKCDVDSKQFKDALRDVWIPLLIERVQTPSETHYLTRTAHDEQLLGPGPSPSASAHRVQHELQSPGSGTEWVNRNYSSSSSGAFPPASSSCVELQVDVHSEQLDHDVSGLYPSFDNQMFEQGNTTLPFGVGGGGDFDSLLDSSWNDGNIWLLPQLWNDLQIKDNFLA